MPHTPIQPGTGNYYKDVIAAKKEITTASKELKVHKIDLACGAMQKAITLLMPYSNNRLQYQVPQAGGGQPKQGPAFTQATTEGIRLCSDASSELDFKMVENAVRTLCNAMSLNLPYAENW